MARFATLIKSLRGVEQQLEGQLQGIRTAISSLSFGSAVSPAIPRRGASQPKEGLKRRRKMSAAARAKISAAQKKRWARVKATNK